MLLPAHGFQFTHSFLFQESKKLIPLSMDVYLYCFVFYFGRKFSLYYPPYFAIFRYSRNVTDFFYINGKFNSLIETFLVV